MITDIWNTIFYEPFYNALVFLVDLLPGGDIGFAIIILTIIVKLILFPLSQKSIKSQAKLRALQPQLDEIKKKHEDKQVQAKETFALYKANNVNPFAGCLTILIQLPIIFALYFVFLKGFDLKADILYPFVSYPENIHTHFLGLIDMAGKSLVLALLAGATQFVNMQLSHSLKLSTTSNDSGMKGQIMKSMNMQMKYVLPVFIAFFAYQISAAVALYWTVSNLFSIGQEYVIKKNTEKHATRGN